MKHPTAHLLLSCVPKLEQSFVCCFCGTRTEKGASSFFTVLDDESGDEPVCACLRCACRYWYWVLIPEDGHCKEHMLSVLLNENFFGDGLVVSTITKHNCTMTPEAVYGLVQEILRTTQNRRVAIFLPGTKGGTVDKRLHLLFWDAHTPSQYWLLPGTYEELRSFLLAFRWTAYYLPRTTIIRNPNWIIIVTDDSSAPERFCVTLWEDNFEYKLELFHYGNERCRIYAMAGASFYLEQSNIPGLQIMTMPEVSIVPQRIFSPTSLRRKIKEMLA